MHNTVYYIKWETGVIKTIGKHNRQHLQIIDVKTNAQNIFCILKLLTMNINFLMYVENFLLILSEYNFCKIFLQVLHLPVLYMIAV